MKRYAKIWFGWVAFVSFIAGQLVSKIGETTETTVYTWKVPVVWILLCVGLYLAGYYTAKDRYTF